MLRDEFAKAALMGFASSVRPGTGFNIDLVAKQAYELADAMVRQSKVPYKTTEEIAVEYAAFKNGTANHDNCAPCNNPEIACAPSFTTKPEAWAIEDENGLQPTLHPTATLARHMAQAYRTDGIEGKVVPLYRAPTLTDEEREAVERAAFVADNAGLERSAATLRKLLERLK